jgi:hypothetical protein
MFEFAREGEPTGVAGVSVQIGEDFGHAAEFGVEHSLELGLIEFGEDAFGPGGEIDFEFERKTVAGVTIGIAKTRVVFVEDVPRRPEAVEIEAAGANVPLSDFIETFFAVGKSAEVTIALGILDEFEFGDDVIGAFFETRITGGGEHEAYGREVMAGDVAGEVFGVAIPAAVGFCFGFETGAFAEIGEHAVGFEFEEIGGIEVLGVFERTAGETHGREGQGTGDVGDDGLDGSGECDAGGEQ